MKTVIVSILVLINAAVFSQQRLVPISSFYKDQTFGSWKKSGFNNGGFFPYDFSESDLLSIINDSSKQYYDFTETLFKKHLVEIKGSNFRLNISPLIDFSTGRDISDTLKRKLFQNTRGVYIEGDLGKDFSFSTCLAENQGRYARYQSEFYSAHGELYPGGAGYYSQNAVIPGGARTKPFKIDAFDYAFAIGYLVYRPLKYLTISAGNNHHFVGDGHRSLLLSDNSYSAPYFLLNWKIGSKFSFRYMRSRHLNLLRRGATSSAESYYESKGYSMNYFTYSPTKSISLSLFEGVYWNRGDSISSKFSHPLYYLPAPFVGPALVDPLETNALYGINFNWQPFDKHRIYAQVASQLFDQNGIAWQFGYRGYDFFGLKNFMIQTELNSVPVNFYEDNDNSRLNYAHYNLPTAHLLGNGFFEVVFRANYEWNRVYIDQQTSYFQLGDRTEVVLMPITIPVIQIEQRILYNRTEIGYRFNRKMNLCAFVNAVYRSNKPEDHIIFNTGVRTGIFNNYTDF